MFNIVTIRISPLSNRALVTAVKDFYASPETKPLIERTRFCLDLFDVYDHNPDH